MHSPRMTIMQQVLTAEAQALSDLADNLPAQAAAVAAAGDAILQRTGEHLPGRLVCTGVGKAGLVARKISATFASTGTPGFFLHPSEALHGDLGMLRSDDVVLALSNSGSSDELVALLPSLTRIGCLLIAVSGRLDSPLARHAHCCLHLGHLNEACPLGLAPSTTTTAMLALGDALALSVLQERQFTPEQYARFHPGGALGRKLMTCAEAMRHGERMALVTGEQSVLSAMRAIGGARAGSAVVVDEQQRLQGILTDGDIRRALTGPGGGAVIDDSVASHATMPCKAVGQGDLLSTALGLCARHHINELPVVDPQQVVVGLIDIQDLVSRGFDIHAQRDY